jgi:hypothetical protein
MFDNFVGGPVWQPEKQWRFCVGFRESSMRIAIAGSEAQQPFDDINDLM